jgi:hypothetical protein
MDAEIQPDVPPEQPPATVLTPEGQVQVSRAQLMAEQEELMRRLAAAQAENNDRQKPAAAPHGRPAWPPKK